MSDSHGEFPMFEYQPALPISNGEHPRRSPRGDLGRSEHFYPDLFQRDDRAVIGGCQERQCIGSQGLDVAHVPVGKRFFRN